MSLRATLADLKWPAITSVLLATALLAIRYIDRRLNLGFGVALALLIAGSCATLLACALFPIIRRLDTRGRPMREITISDVVSEARGFLGYERHAG